jgi:HTH-type transcriptional regulator/antitoxin HigA
MPNISELKPFKVFGPGTFISEQMEIREWTQADLAEVLSMTAKHINALLNNKLRITTDMAQRLSGAFGQSANYWLNIDAGYQLHKSANQTTEDIANKKATIYEKGRIKNV